MRRRKIRLGRVLLALSLLIIIGFGVLFLLYYKDNFFVNGEVKIVDIDRALSFNNNNSIKSLIAEEVDVEENVDISKEYEEKKELVLKRINARRGDMLKAITNTDDNRKIAYLTFDDGPSKVSTPKILDILDKYEVKATFFVQGRNVDIYPDILKDIYKRGHAIGNHSYSHDYKKMYKDEASFLEDIDKAEATMKKHLGDDFDTKLLRFPGGCFGQNKQALKNAVLQKRDYVSYNWNCLNGDAEGKLFSREHLFNRFKATAGSKKKLVILMHDTDAKKTTPDALIDIIEYLKQNEFEFATLPEY
ncbi:MAG: polysaccharide deacetylase [Tissierellia bacterium]|nr:polysaccharide deacetylase [Tissierellia bacterium]